MRWQSPRADVAFDGALEAVPIALVSRDEDAHHHQHQHQHQQPQTSVRATSAKTSARGTSAQLSARRVGTAEAATTRQYQYQQPPQQQPGAADAPRFLVCAGKAVHSATPSPRGSCSSNNNNNSADGGDALDEYAFPALTAMPIALPLAVAPTPVASNSEQRPRSQRALQRSDSELELIISELREKIAQQQRDGATAKQQRGDGYSRQQQQPEDATPTSSSQSLPSRKHLKNPVERMQPHQQQQHHGVATSGSSSKLLRRQPSASSVNRLVSEGTASMVTPAVISTSTSRTALGSSGSHVTLDARSRDATTDSHAGYSGHYRSAAAAAAEFSEVAAATHSDSGGGASRQNGMRIRSYASPSLDASGNATTSLLHHNNPHFASSTSLGLPQPAMTHPQTQGPSRADRTRVDADAPRRSGSSTDLAASTCASTSASQSQPRAGNHKVRTLADMDLELERLGSGLGGLGGLGVLGGDQDADAGSLSPVGPWVIDYDAFSNTSNSGGVLLSSRSVASLASSASASALHTPPAETTAALSPRSRLLWLSDFGEDEAWTSTRVLQMLRPGARPASAHEARRRPSRPTASASSKHVRAGSAKAAMRRSSASSSSSNSNNNSHGNQTASVARPSTATAGARRSSKSGSGNGGSTTTSSASSNLHTRMSLRAPHRA